MFLVLIVPVHAVVVATASGSKRCDELGRRRRCRPRRHHAISVVHPDTAGPGGSTPDRQSPLVSITRDQCFDRALGFRDPRGNRDPRRVDRRAPGTGSWPQIVRGAWSSWRPSVALPTVIMFAYSPATTYLLSPSQFHGQRWLCSSEFCVLWPSGGSGIVAMTRSSPAPPCQCLVVIRKEDIYSRRRRHRHHLMRHPAIACEN